MENGLCSCKSSTRRETEAVSRVIQSNVDILKDSSVKVFSDNKNVKSVLLNGSRKTDIQGSVLALHDVCEKRKYHIKSRVDSKRG